jgi:hypothetical protein
MSLIGIKFLYSFILALTELTVDDVKQRAVAMGLTLSRCHGLRHLAASLFLELKTINIVGKSHRKHF